MFSPRRWLLFIACADAAVAISLGAQVLTRNPSPRVWSPTQPATSAEFAGSSACSPCHERLTATQQVSGMAKALRTAENCQVLASHPSLTFRNGEYSYHIVRESGRSIYKVTHRDESISTPVSYCFGHGETGQTYLLQYNGSFYESRVSFYPSVEKLDFTVGAPKTEPESLEAALGQKMTADEALKCFSCHATNAVHGSQQVQLEQLAPGISCEACHGPAADHVAAAKAGQPAKSGMPSLSKLPGDELSQRSCGSCHRSFEEVMAMPDIGGMGNLRFQPYRLAKSSCYQSDPKDRRVSCVACHDPHKGLVRDPSFYDAKCRACHAVNANAPSEAAAKVCRKATQKCAACHMPKTNLPEAHAQFTDHFIRVVRGSAFFPK